MKNFFLLTFLMTSTAFALPVFNRNVASSGNLVTIWPDHLDPNQFYFAPNMMMLALKSNGKPKFNVTYFKNECEGLKICKKKAMINAFFIADMNRLELIAAKESISKRIPGARFSPAPFMESRVEFGLALDAFVEKHDCAPSAGQTSDEVPCSITLNKTGIKTLIPYLNDGKIVPFKFFYKMSGVLQNAAGQYTDSSMDYSIAVNLGGDILISNDDLN